jgi:hypothetical protein
MARKADSSKIDTVFARVAARSGRVQLTGAELARAGVPAAALSRAVRAGALRQGSAGYWLPTAGDFGAALIFRNALSETHAPTEE